jgi:hypothetical protein
MFFELSPAALSSGLGGLMAQPFDGVLQIGVPQQGLNRTQVRTAFEQVGRPTE